jgi:hypothetical protein
VSTDEPNIVLLGNRNGHSNSEIKTLKHVIGKVVKNRQLRCLDNDTLVTLFIIYLETIINNLFTTDFIHGSRRMNYGAQSLPFCSCVIFCFNFATFFKGSDKKIS